MKIDVNCDMGESFGRYTLGNDAALIQHISSANIACGLHAGDPQVMDKTVLLAIKNGVAIGAHPGYPDLQGFGRRTMDLSPEEIEAFILFQIGALYGFVRSSGGEIVHVKPHGALYNQAAKDREPARAIAKAVKRFSGSLILVGLAGSLLVEMGAEAGLRTANEGFPERGYNPDGTLMSRKLPGAVIDSPEKAATQALNLVRNGIRVSMGGKESVIQVDTLCIHGDSPNALAVSRAIRETLKDNQIDVKRL
jgi:5-oxoprolinase (ATP-hydrolysing) subunit A